MAMVSLDRTPDGRHAVLDAQGRALGIHNSLASAQRQIADYYEPPIAKAGPQVGGPGTREVAPVREQIQQGAEAQPMNQGGMQMAMQDQMLQQKFMQDQAHHAMLQAAGVNPMMQAAHQVFNPAEQANPLQAWGNMGQSPSPGNGTVAPGNGAAMGAYRGGQ